MTVDDLCDQLFDARNEIRTLESKLEIAENDVDYYSKKTVIDLMRANEKLRAAVLKYKEREPVTQHPNDKRTLQGTIDFLTERLDSIGNDAKFSGNDIIPLLAAFARSESYCNLIDSNGKSFQFQESSESSLRAEIEQLRLQVISMRSGPSHADCNRRIAELDSQNELLSAMLKDEAEPNDAAS